MEGIIRSEISTPFASYYGISFYRIRYGLIEDNRGGSIDSIVCGKNVSRNRDAREEVESREKFYKTIRSEILSEIAMVSTYAKTNEQIQLRLILP